MNNQPTLNTVVDHLGGYGIFKGLRKKDGVVHCILVDPKTPGYRDPDVQGDRYAVPIDQCQWMPEQSIDAIALDNAVRAQGEVVGAWLTPGKPAWWTDFEQRLIEATTWEQLQQAKAKASASRRTQIMNVWADDGRYEWLKAKAARLDAESSNATQGSLGQ
jgi:hypothetical protein